MYYDRYVETELFDEFSSARLPMCRSAYDDLLDLLRLTRALNKNMRILRRLVKQRPRNQTRINSLAVRARRDRVTLENHLKLMLFRTTHGQYLSNGCTRKDIAKLTYVVRKLRGPWRTLRTAGTLRNKLVFRLRNSRGAFSKTSCTLLFGSNRCKEIKRLIGSVK